MSPVISWSIALQLLNTSHHGHGPAHPPPVSLIRTLITLLTAHNHSSASSCTNPQAPPPPGFMHYPLLTLLTPPQRMPHSRFTPPHGTITSFHYLTITHSYSQHHSASNRPPPASRLHWLCSPPPSQPLPPAYHQLAVPRDAPCSRATDSSLLVLPCSPHSPLSSLPHFLLLPLPPCSFLCLPLLFFLSLPSSPPSSPHIIIR